MFILFEIVRRATYTYNRASRRPIKPCGQTDIDDTRFSTHYIEAGGKVSVN